MTGHQPHGDTPVIMVTPSPAKPTDLNCAGARTWGGDGGEASGRWGGGGEASGPVAEPLLTIVTADTSFADSVEWVEPPAFEPPTGIEPETADEASAPPADDRPAGVFRPRGPPPPPVACPRGQASIWHCCVVVVPSTWH